MHTPSHASLTESHWIPDDSGPSLQPGEVAHVLSQSAAVGILLVPDVRGNPLASTVWEWHR